MRVIRFDDLLCNSVDCTASFDKLPLYRDASHFSQEGSKLIGTKMALSSVVESLAK